MKKLITAFCVLVVTIGSLLAVVKDVQAVPYKTTRVSDNDRNSGVYAKDSFTESAPFDQSPNGYGWQYGYNKKIAWSPEANLYVGAYRQKNVAGTGTIGGMNGNWLEGNFPITIEGQSASMNCRYPSVAVQDKYGFAIFNHNAVNPASAYIAVFDKDEEGWTVPIAVKNADGTAINGAWCGTGDVTKDAVGMYYIATSWEYDGLNANGAKKLAVIVGNTNTPYDVNSWSWTNSNALTIAAGTGGQFYEVERCQTAWGKNGFGIAMIIGTEDEAAMTGIYYAYTKDYGQTWVKDAEGKFFKVTASYPFVGKSYASDAGDVLIEQAFTMWNTDITVDENNDVHLLCKAVVGEGTSILLSVDKATDGSPVNGYWLWTGKFDNQGNPEAADWEADFVAHYVGHAESDNTPAGADGQPERFDYKSSNRNTMSLGYCGNGIIVASWLDRAPTDAMLSETAGTLLGANWEADIKFMEDPYFIVSRDYGKTWAYADAALKRAHQITVNTDQKILEEGFVVTPRGVFSNNPYRLEMYAVYQKAKYDAQWETPTKPSSYEQNLHVLRMIYGEDGIETEDITDGKTIELAQNYPNPFNPTTIINFNLQTSANVKLAVFNAQGQEVANLINAKMDKGAHSANFNAANLNSGVYFYKLSVDGQSAVKKMVLTK